MVGEDGMLPDTVAPPSEAQSYQASTLRGLICEIDGLEEFVKVFYFFSFFFLLIFYTSPNHLLLSSLFFAYISFFYQAGVEAKFTVRPVNERREPQRVFVQLQTMIKVLLFSFQIYCICFPLNL